MNERSSPSAAGNNSSAAKAEVPVSFALETYAARSINYLERLVDADGLPYFNVFWTQPAEAAHDWPDLGDVMSRQLEGAVMLRHMTGREAATEKLWLRKLLSLIDPADGQVHRPRKSYCKPTIEDAALPLGALNACAIDGSEEAQAAAAKMAEGYLRRLRDDDLRDKPLHCFSGFTIKALMVAARMLQSEAAFEAARLLVDRHIQPGRAFAADNTFGLRTHVHGMLKSLVGTADYALTAGRAELYSRVDALYRHVKSLGTRFGFLPEVINWRTSDMVACETCALMDFAGLGVTLAGHGHPEYWGDMERLARNHLVESQVRDVAWLQGDDGRADTEQFTWRDIGSRIVGAWAGWSSPNHILAYRETLNAHWGGPELRDKTRLLQNCCGGSGVHALFILWKNAARFEDGMLSVNMHLDKKLPEAEIRCEQPYRGVLRIALRRDCAVRVRIPEFTHAAQLQVSVNGIRRPVARNFLRDPSLMGEALPQDGTQPACRVSGNYLELGPCQARDRIEVSYPLPVATEEAAVGNAGFRQWRYRVTWKGDTVIRMEPLGNEVKTAYSDFDKVDREVFYGQDGPGPLYRREHMLPDGVPVESSLHLDDGSLDLWRIRPR
jgi:hypothetical protein